ncbi:hypothetical protein BXY80_0194 [Ichthyenterobacterium magnum]|uniref:Uncharacterized protein n=1 Tax=Ichthyenterobacterium magnum TaxID=1230530 RepID=A0A420DUZ4_9FLAO|nr:hypothetical protein BXY80_0194 [Ichthyenterobacterium magnum]
MKKYFGYILILLSIYFAFFRGKRQGKLDCIDFNVLSIVDNAITIIVCLSLMIVGSILIKRKFNSIKKIPT